MDIAAIELRSVTVSTGSPPMCGEHGIFMRSIMVAKGNHVKQEYECGICVRIVTDDINTLTREVLFEKHVKWQLIRNITKKIAKKTLK